MKRYAIKPVKNTCAADHGVVTAELKVVQDDEGEWVRYSDVEQKMDGLQFIINRSAELLQKGHKDEVEAYLLAASK